MFNLAGQNCVQSDAELVELAREGNQQAFATLISRHYRTCVNIATFMLRDRGEAQDEVQNACCKVYQHLEQYHGEAEFVTWMLRIVVNQCLMLIRVRRRTRFLYIDADTEPDRNTRIDLPAATPDPEEEVSDGELRDVVQREIRRIPPLLRNVLMLHDVGELPMADVAARLRITIPAAKSRLLRARLELRTRIMRHCGDGSHGGPLSKTTKLPAKSGRRWSFVH